MMLTLGQAATATGKRKSTISNAIKNRRITAEKDEKGYWQIDPARLFQIYDPVQSNSTKTPQTGRGETPLKTANSSILKKEVDLLREQLSDLKDDRDHWRQQATALLTDQRPKPDKSGALDRFKIWVFGDKQANSNKTHDPRMTAA